MSSFYGVIGETPVLICLRYNAYIYLLKDLFKNIENLKHKYGKVYVWSTYGWSIINDVYRQIIFETRVLQYDIKHSIIICSKNTRIQINSSDSEEICRIKDLKNGEVYNKKFKKPHFPIFISFNRKQPHIYGLLSTYNDFNYCISLTVKKPQIESKSINDGIKIDPTRPTSGKILVELLNKYINYFLKHRVDNAKLNILWNSCKSDKMYLEQYLNLLRHVIIKNKIINKNPVSISASVKKIKMTKPIIKKNTMTYTTHDITLNKNSDYIYNLNTESGNFLAGIGWIFVKSICIS